MTWKLVDDPKVLDALRMRLHRESRLIGIRKVFLSASGFDVLALWAAPGSFTDVGKDGRVFKMRLYDTDPSAVVVSEGSEESFVGVCIWTGNGKVLSSHDEAMEELACLLDEDFLRQSESEVQNDG